MTIRGAELLSADLKDCDEIRMGGSHQSPLVPPTHMFRSPGGRADMSVQLARPEAKVDYWHRHSSTVLSVTTVKH